MTFDKLSGPEQSQPEHEQHAQNRQQLSFIQRELIEFRPDIVDGGLREAVTEWLLDVQDARAQDPQEHISSTLSDIRRQYPMFRTRKHRDGTEAFPDACEDCEHYGIACPVLTDNDQIQRRERIMDNSETANELRRRLRDYAIDNGCLVMQEALSEVSESHEPLLKRGQLLLMAVEERVLFDNESEAIARAIAGDKTLDTADGLLNAELDFDALEEHGIDADGEENGVSLEGEI